MNWSIHHVNLQAFDVKASAHFYREVVGLSGQQSWPLKNTSGIGDVTDDTGMLFGGDDYRGLHLVKGDPNFGRSTNLILNPTVGGHPAFTVPDLAAVARRLDAAGIPYSLNPHVFMAGVRNMYLYDPSFNLIEINEVVG